MMEHVRPDVVVLDLEMPEMNGFETLAALRQSHPRLPVIVYSHLSAQGATATLEALALGATDFALKPRADGIGLAVEQVRERARPAHHRRLPPDRKASTPTPPRPTSASWGGSPPWRWPPPPVARTPWPSS